MKRPFEQHEIEYIRQNYSDTLTAEIAAVLGRSLRSVYNKSYELGLLKSDEFINSGKCGRLQKGHNRGKDTRFKPGHKTWNKDKKLGKEWTKGRMGETQFKPGHLPHNTKPEGDGALSKRGRYWYIRLSLGHWRQLHTYTWENSNGPINPKTEMVKFRDGNPDNCDLENLYLETRSGNMKSNTIHNYPPEIKDSIIALTTLKKKIKNHGKES